MRLKPALKQLLPGLLAVLALCVVQPLRAQGAAPSRVVLGGRAVIMVADAVYAFPGARARVAAIAGADQGLGYFLGALDAAYASLPVVDRSAGAETYAALKPDLIILKRAMKATLGAQLEAIGLKTLYVDLETPEDYLRDLAVLGATFGEQARAAELAAFYRDRLADIERRLVGAARPRVLVLQASAGSGVWEAPPAAWMQTAMTRLSGGEPIWTRAALGSGWTRLGAEEIAAMDPDCVVIVGYRDDSRALSAAFREDPRFAGLSALKSGRIFAMPQDFYSWDQPDTRWILGLSWLARRLHPERFADAPLEAELRAFFKTLYGLEGARYEALIPPRLRGDHGLEPTPR